MRACSVAPFTGPHDTPVGPLFGLGYGPRVASLTTIATPHFGSVIADAVVQDIPGHKQAVKALMCSLNLITALIRGEQQDTDRAVKALSRAFMLDYFNDIIEDDPERPLLRGRRRSRMPRRRSSVATSGVQGHQTNRSRGGRGPKRWSRDRQWLALWKPAAWLRRSGLPRAQVAPPGELDTPRRH